MVVKKRGLFGVVLALFLVIIASILVTAEVNGCYVYPKASEDVYCVSGILFSEAETDCKNFADCNINSYFIPGSDCSSLSECDQVICNVDCQTHAMGKCEQLAKADGKPAVGISSQSPDYTSLNDYWCKNTNGCCQLIKNSGEDNCFSGINQYECNLKADQLLITNSENILFYGAITSQGECQAKCGIAVASSNLNILVKDSSNSAPLNGVKVSLETPSKETITTSLGIASFDSLSPKTYLVKVSKDGYAPASATVLLAAGVTYQYNFTLFPMGETFSLSGIVTDSSGKIVDGAMLVWEDSKNVNSKGTTYTNTLGKYNLSGLPKSDIAVTASKKGYEFVKKSKTLISNTENFNFVLKKAVSTGVSGIVYLDFNNNQKKDNDDKVVYDAKIYVDGVFKAYSQYPDGKYEVSIVISSGSTEKHNITATYQDYEMEPLTVDISKDVSTVQNLLLTRFIGECSENGDSPKKNVEEFVVSQVLGKKEVQLNWAKPCAEVVGYIIEKYQGEVFIENIPKSPAENFHLDNKVEWGETYTYKIIAVYSSSLTSETPAEYTITLGDADCENRYHEDTGWETFCLSGVKDIRKTVWTCDESNKLIYSLSCGERDGIGEDYYCAKVAERVAECKDAGICGLFADPFGLYHNKEVCYGNTAVAGFSQNFCYYDYTNTIVDACKSCTEISTCFDYNSKDACTINSCLGDSCEWINGAANINPLVDYSLLLSGTTLPNLVTAETGAGYCVKKDYKKDDRCSLCGPTASLFEDYYCTAQVCSGLGNCFSAGKLEYCQACGEYPTKEATCYAYNTESECVGSMGLSNSGLQKDSLSKISLSEDRCGWGRCIWQGVSGGAGKCVKDGDGNNQDDCTGFYVSGELVIPCAIDNSAPRTTITPEGINVISLAAPNLTFVGTEDHQKYANQKNKMGVLGYCLTSADLGASDGCVIINGNNPFVEVAYAGKLTTESVTVNLINSTFLKSPINGKTYRVKFYSKDKFFNQENIQEGFVYVDNVVPAFEIKSEIETKQDLTTLTVVLEKTEEIMDCNFKLDQIVPAGTSQSKSVLKDTFEKKVVFENLPGVKYKLNVTCTDNQGNVNSQPKDYAFDLEQDILLVYPKPYQVISETNIEFKIETAVGATCSLYLVDTNEKLVDFITDETGKVHHTQAVSLLSLGLKTGISPEGDHSEFEAYCTELYTAAEIPKEHSEIFVFTVDFTPPNTQIILTEGAREVRPAGYGWEEYFVSSAQVDFECTNEGFECDTQKYCLGVGCDLIDSPDYKEYTIAITISNSTQICYYSTDVGNNTLYQLTCGKVIIDGYGITLEKPKLYYYENEMWGISSLPIFDWQFSTRVPTQECAFDFTSGFDYASTPSQNIKLPNGESKYLYENFPESIFSEYSEDGEVKEVYVKCKNGEEEISPEQKMNLEYDPTAPVITEASANPDLVFEGVTTNLMALTDDKTICRFSDNSDGEGTTDFNLMNYLFPAGDDENILSLNHSIDFTINSVGENGKRDYSLWAGCQNGAGDVSEAASINFSADYSAVGYIIESSIQPSGYINGKDVTLSLITSKTGQCQVKLDNTTFTSMGTLDAKTHSSVLGNVVDGDYKYPIKCRMGDHNAEAAFEFVVDTKAPIITAVETGNYTCGSDTMSVMVRSNETALESYYYELYDLGETSISNPVKANTNIKTSANTSLKTTLTNQTNNPTSISTNNQTLNSSKSTTTTVQTSTSALSSSTSGSAVMVMNASVGLSLPFQVEYEFNESHKYQFKVLAVDAAENYGALKESNVFLAVPHNYSVCKEDKSAPKISVGVDASECDAVVTEIYCDDETSCKTVKYGRGTSANACVANITYLGEKISFTKNGWLCYYAEDVTGHNISKIEPIILVDKDGDGVVDKCDKCTTTGANKIVDKTGCASEEPSLTTKLSDLDKDGLPDNWEKEYDTQDCVFDFTNADSDTNGVSDSQDDYDKDGSTNHQEYVTGTDPCVANKLAEKTTEDEVIQKINVIPTVTTSPVNLTAWIVLIMGLLLLFGGSGYLIYYYKSMPSKYSPTSRPTAAQLSQAAGVRREVSQPASWKEKIFQLQRKREEQTKQRSREDVFGSFSRESKEIPHVDKIISSKGAVLPKLQQVAEKYVEHKDEIKSGLKPEEKNIFAKLENIANQTKDKKIHQVVSKEEAGDIFAKLKTISKKRKS